MIFNISELFIKRPVLTSVCTILIVLIGLIAIPFLPLEKLPDMAFKQVTVSANYLGTDAKTVEENVTTVLEQQINGTEQVVYIQAQSDNTGNGVVNVYFPVEMDRNIAQVLVQNQVSIAQSNLPSEVVRNGVITQKQSPTVTIAYGVYAEKGGDGKPIYDSVFLSNYVDRVIDTEIKKIEGIGSTLIVGQRQYAMRIWLNPDALAARNVSVAEVNAAINEQNLQVGGGRIGQAPIADEQQFEIAIRAVGRIETAEDAENIVVKVGENGALIRIKDVGRAEVGAQNYSSSAYFDGNPGIAYVIYQLPGTNAWNTAALIRQKMEELRKDFPPGLRATVTIDSTDFVSASLEEAFGTLIEAILLVVLVIFVFLQDWRVTLIPAIAIPVSLIGTMGVVLAMGYTLNNLTLFAIILATGLVVDDGIVVVEAVSEKLRQGMRPMQAALDAMGELNSAIIASTLVLLAVFIPVTFFPGTTGIVYKQFAIVIVASILISTFNALSFSPSMGAIIMQPPRRTHGPLGWFFDVFNRGFDLFKGGYTRIVEFMIKIRYLVFIIFLAGLVATGIIYTTTPEGFIPEEDQGYGFMLIEAPAGVSLNYTDAAIRKIGEEVLSKVPEVEHYLGMSGFGFAGTNTNLGLFFIKFKNWSERPLPNQTAFGVLRTINQQLRQRITEVRAVAVNAPPVDGLSSTGGFEMFIQNRGGLPVEALSDNVQRVMAEARKRPELTGIFTQFVFNSPMLEVSVDRNKMKAQNVDMRDVFSTLQTYLGSSYVNQFILGGRLYRVFTQADTQYRSNPQDIDKFYVRSLSGGSVPLSALVNIKQFTYPPITYRFNLYPAVKIQGGPAAGYSSGQALIAMEEVANKVLQPGFSYAWTGTAFQERSAGGAAPIIFGLAFLVVFLVLAAQYESYVDPTIIMITVPLAILGALGALVLRANTVQVGTVFPAVNNNMYAQVALVMLIGLAAKNAILIVEFANQSRDLGMDIRQSAVRASSERLRPILMTAVSGILGFFPLVVASGAGAMSRWSLGTALFGGYAISTALSLFLVPVLYVIIKDFEDSFLKGGKKGGGGKSTPPGGGTQPLPVTASQEGVKTNVEDPSLPSLKMSEQNE
ncbi:MAG: Efflux pump membrane transporter BepE [Chroococcopsis gigantea SAG 12.99]|jgi:hydrophobe/amphiphile efflux-1 (HAE1) family protein|nr:Efflux pump membrane transporter BepE [Chroococcopsis gigantea SAG 12.99]